MATDTAQKQSDTKPPESPTPATPANSTTPAKSAASTGTAKPKTKSKPRAKTAAKSRTRSTASPSRSRTASKSRSRKPAARTTRTETATAPRAQAKALNGGQQFVAGVIDAQEKTVTAIVDYQTRAAELSQIPGATAVAEAQAKVLRSVTDTYVSAARAFLK